MPARSSRITNDLEGSLRPPGHTHSSSPCVFAAVSLSRLRIHPETRPMTPLCGARQHAFHMCTIIGLSPYLCFLPIEARRGSDGMSRSRSRQVLFVLGLILTLRVSRFLASFFGLKRTDGMSSATQEKPSASLIVPYFACSSSMGPASNARVLQD